MPLISLTVRKPKSLAFKSTVLDAVHAALVSAGVPVTDKFQRVIELEAEDFRFDPDYPDLKTSRTDDFVLIEILWIVVVEGCGPVGKASRGGLTRWPRSDARDATRRRACRTIGQTGRTS